jgi:hypothetical protein
VVIPSFLHSASLPLAQPFTDHTEQALCSAKKVNQENLVLNANFGIPLDSVKPLPRLLTSHHHWLDAA